MLYILAGAQIGQSPKKTGRPAIICIQHFWCTFKLTALMSDVTLFDMFGLDQTHNVSGVAHHMYMFTCLQLWPMYGEPPVLLPGPV